MLLAIDVGNTNVTFAVFDGAIPLADWRVSTQADRTADEYAGLLLTLFEEKEIRFAHIDCVGISSVVPSTIDSLVRFSHKHLHIDEPIVISANIELGIRVNYNPVSDVGADRIVNAVAAHSKYPGPVIVVDFGTATTLDAVSSDGTYLGGAIAPGIRISLDALFSRAARLTGVALEAPLKAIGTTTAASLQSGIVFGYAGQVDALVNRFLLEMEDNVTVIATGGQADLIAKYSRTIQKVDDLLTLEGIRMACEKICNKGRSA